MFKVTTYIKPQDSTHCFGCKFFLNTNGEENNYDSCCDYFSMGLQKYGLRCDECKTAEENSKKTIKIAIHREYGGFGISGPIYKEYLRLLAVGGIEEPEEWGEFNRTDPNLILAIEKFPKSAKAQHLKIVEIPADVDWGLFDYDGVETVYDKNRYWE